MSTKETAIDPNLEAFSEDRPNSEGPTSEGPSSIGPASEERPRLVRERRRKRKRFEPDTSVPSPCVAVCIIEKPSRLCRGCKRSIDEIRDWMIMDAEAKRDVLAQLPERKI